MRHGHHQDRHLGNLARRQRARLVLCPGGAQPAFDVRAGAGAFQALAALGDLHLVGVRQVEGQVCSRGVALSGRRLQAAQDDLLQPLGQVAPARARRLRIHPQALAQAALAGRRAKRQLARGQLVKHHADGEYVAARVAAHTHHLLGRHVGGRADGVARFLGQQIRVVGVKAEAKVQQHRRAVALDDDVGRLQVEVYGVLFVQAVRGVRHGGAQLRQRFGCEQHALVDLIQPMVERAARHVFHHQIGQHRQIARRHQVRHVRAVQRLHHLVLDLEADDGLGAIAGRHARHLHHHGEGRGAAVGVGDVIDQRHAALVAHLAQLETVDDGVRHQRFHWPNSSRSAKKAGSGVARMAAAAAGTS